MKFEPRFLAMAATLLFSLTSIAQQATERAGLKDFAWKTGQVVAISELIQDSSTFFFEAASASRFGHIGVVVVENGKVSVYESDPLVKGAGVEPIDSFIARSEDLNGKFNYVVLDAALSDVQARALTKKAKQIVTKKVPYNFKQIYLDNAEKLNCSEYVFHVFEGIAKVGEIQTVRESIVVGAFNGGLQKLNDLVDGGPLPQPTDLVVTPLSIVKSPALRVMKSTLPLARPLSESETFAAWDTGGGFIAMIAGYGARLSGAKDIRAYIKGLQADPTTSAELTKQAEFIKGLLKTQPLSTTPSVPFPASFRTDEDPKP